MKTLNAAITAIASHGYLSEADQLASIALSLPAAGITMVSSKQPLEHIKEFGFRYVKSIEDAPLLKEAVGRYVSQVRGRETVAIYAPDVVVAHDFEDMLNRVSNLRLELVWGFHCSVPERPNHPKAFFLTSPILHHIFQDIPTNLSFSGEEWAVWLHEKLTRFMQPHKYLDASDLNLVELYIPPAPPPPDHAPEPELVPATLEPTQAPVVKPKKKKKHG